MTTQTVRPKVTTLLALLLVPLLVAGGFLWGTWNANPRLRTVQAAVVNLDEMVEVNGQKMPLGRQLAAELVDTDREQNLTWVLADAKRARAGLADGTYAAVVTIPREFSAAASSFAQEPGEARQAAIHVETSPVTGVSETALGQNIADAAANSLNRFLTGEYLKNIYVGFNQMGEQFTELKDGTAQLADGATQLSDGTREAASGAGKLADGLGLASDGGPLLRSGAHQLADGTVQLAGGARELADGTGLWADGAELWASGAGEYTGGVAQYVGAVNPVLTQVRDVVSRVPDWGDLVVTLDPVVAQLDDWAERLDPQVQAFVRQLRQFLGKVDALTERGADLDATLDAYATRLTTTAIQCPAELEQTAGACEAFDQGVAEAQAKARAQLGTAQQQAGRLLTDARAVSEAVTALSLATDRLSGLSTEFAAWAPTAQDSWETLKQQLPNGTLTKTDVLGLLDQFVQGGDLLVSGGDQLTAGATELATGARQIATGTGELAAGADQLASGQGQYAAGIDQYTTGIDQAASGSRELAGGLGQLGDGASQLADGTRELADGVAEGAGEIPTYTEEERTNLARVVASPVDTSGLEDLVQPTIAWASLLLVMALWIGALAAYSVFRAVDPRNLVSSAPNGRLLWRSLAPGLAVVATQGLALSALGAWVVGLDAARAVGVAGVALIAAAAFVAVNHALVAWFGTTGRVVSLAFLLVTVVSAVAYSAPETLGALRPLSPLSPALDAIRMVMTGHSASLPVLGLVAWLLAAAAASFIAVVRSRTVKLAALVAA